MLVNGTPYKVEFMVSFPLFLPFEGIRKALKPFLKIKALKYNLLSKEALIA